MNCKVGYRKRSTGWMCDYMKIELSETGEIIRADGFAECVESRPDTAQVVGVVIFLDVIA